MAQYEITPEEITEAFTRISKVFEALRENEYSYLSESTQRALSNADDYIVSILPTKMILDEGKPGEPE